MFLMLGHFAVHRKSLKKNVEDESNNLKEEIIYINVDHYIAWAIRTYLLNNISVLMYL